MRALASAILLVMALTPLRESRAQLPHPDSGPFYRYIIIVDSSTAMKRRREDAAKSIGRLIDSGFGGNVQLGDTVGIWFFGSDIDTAAAPAFKWAAPLRPAMAAQAMNAVMKRNYRGKSNLDSAIKGVLQASRTSKEVTAFIFSDGNEVIYGTPYDLDISTVYMLHRDDLAKAKQPFVTSLAARDGKIQAWAVDAGGGRVSIPKIEDKPNDPPKTKPPVKPAPKVPQANTSPQKPRPAPRVIQSIEVRAHDKGNQKTAPLSNPDQTKSVPKPTPTVTAAEPPRIVVPRTPDRSTRAPQAQPKATVIKPAPPSPPPTTLAANKPEQPPAPKPTVPGPAKLPSGPPAKPSTPSLEKPTQPAETAATAVKALKPLASSAEAPPHSPTNTPPPPTPSPAQTAIVPPVEDATGPGRFIFMALSLILVAGVIAFLMLRRPQRSAHASLISQSLDKERE